MALAPRCESGMRLTPNHTLPSQRRHLASVAIGFGIGLLSNLGVLPHTRMTGTLIPLGSIVIQLGLMSFYVSRQFAITNQQLREKLTAFISPY